MKRVDRQNLLFGRDPVNAGMFPEVLVKIRKLEKTQRAVALFRAHPEHAVPNFTNLLSSGRVVRPDTG